MRYYCLLITIMLSVASCHYNRQATYDQPFDNIVRSDGITCVIINDLSNISNDDFLHRLYEMKISSIFNFIDIRKPVNYWYYKLFTPQILPITCILLNGVIIDIIPGYSKESFLYIKEVVSKKKMSEEFHFNQQYGYDKSRTIEYLNEVLSLKHAIDEGKFSADLTPLEATEPYALYLYMNGFNQIGDTVLTKIYATKLLEYNSVSSISVYEEEIIQARKILDNDYGIKNIPKIALIDTVAINCQVSQSKEINIEVLNIGNSKLTISDIHTSCTCLEYLGLNEKLILEPMCPVNLPFIFRSEVAGEHYREVYIASNSVESPLCRVTIIANVNDGMPAY